MKLVASAERPTQADWPLNAAACQLAIAGYQSARMRYRHDERIWTELHPDEKQLWIARAVEWLKEIEPERCIYCSHAYKRLGSEYCSDSCSIFSEHNR